MIIQHCTVCGEVANSLPKAPRTHNNPSGEACWCHTNEIVTLNVFREGHVYEIVQKAAKIGSKLGQSVVGTKIECFDGFVWRDPEGGYRYAQDAKAIGLWRGDLSQVISELWEITNQHLPQKIDISAQTTTHPIQA